MNIFSKLLYNTLKPLVLTAFHVYFKKVTVVNPERGKITGPVIANCNHPATLIDPLCSAGTIKRYFHFLANIGLYKSKLAEWFLEQLWCIPIERHIDMKGKPLNNEANFEAAMKLMERGGCLHIAPEGLSEVERRLRKIRTGTSRIALGAESRNDFKLGVLLQPVGITYSNQLQFRSDCMIILGEPIRVADFAEAYRKDDREAVKALTDTIRQRLTDITLVTENDEEDTLLLGIESIQQSENPLDMEKHLWRTKNLQVALRQWREVDEAGIINFRNQVIDFGSKLIKLQTSNRALINPGILVDAASLILTFPAFLLGYISHFLCCWFPKKMNDRFNDSVPFIPTYKFVTGLVTFPLFYALQIYLVKQLTTSSIWTLAYALSLIPSGYLADWWLRKWSFLLEKVNLTRAGDGTINALLNERRLILENHCVQATTWPQR
jgi:1-acyl-sn-glycerol-3-phosphate acyltransferase